MDLTELIVKKVEEVESSGKLEEIIEKNVIKCLEDVIRDSFNWSGEAKKSIEEGLKGKLSIDTDNLNLSRYQKIVTDLVEEHANNTVIKNLSEEIKAAVNKVTEPLDKKEWKLSEIIKKFIEGIDTSYDGVMEDQYGECTLIVKDDRDSWAWVSFDMASDKEEYSCSNRFGLHNDKIFSAKIDDKDYSPFVMETMDKFEAFMFQLYCNNVTIILDEDECELDYCREDVD